MQNTSLGVDVGAVKTEELLRVPTPTIGIAR
jgi:hypothetical protein